MGKDNDVGFSFDAQPFLSGLKKVSGGIENLAKETKKTAASMGKSFLHAMVKMELLKAAGRKIVGWTKELATYMPEIGQSIGIMKDIIMKNLAWPLRQFIVPLLQKMLNWVRDNRTTFVKWGMAIVSIFKIVAHVVKTAWSILQMFIQLIKPSLKLIFGDTAKGMDEVFNMLALKVAFIAQFILDLMEPVMKWLAGAVNDIFPKLVETIVLIGEGFSKGFGDGFTKIKEFADVLMKIFDNWTRDDAGGNIQSILGGIAELFGRILNFVIDIGKNFFEGFAESTKDLMKPLQNIVDAFKRIWDAIFGGSRKEAWDGLFKFFGFLAGTLLKGAMDAIAFAFDLIADVIDSIVKSSIDLINFFKIMGNLATGKSWDFNLTEGGSTPVPTRTHDAVITKKGEVVQTDPDDTLVALKDIERSTAGASGSGQWNQTISIALTVTEGGAREAGRSFAAGLQDGFRQKILTQAVAGGY